MKVHRTGARKGFSLVELLAVVLILAVLAAVAVPLYLNTRKTSAARACKANINAIASAEAAYALRNGSYADMNTLVTSSPEGLSATVKCPLGTSGTSGKADYTIQDSGGDITGGANHTNTITIACPNAGDHTLVLSGSAATDWQRTMSSIGADNQP